MLFRERKVDVKYRCSMKCEGNKTYAEPGKGPVGGMKLVVQVADSERDSGSSNKDSGHYLSRWSYSARLRQPGKARESWPSRP